MLKHSGGNYTPQQVDRCAQMSCAFGKTLDKLVTISGLGEMARHNDGQVRRHYMDDIPRFLQEYTPYGLCSYVPNRFHVGFAGFRHSKTTRDPGSLGYKLNVLSSRLDRWACIAQYHWTGQWTFHGCNCLLISHNRQITCGVSFISVMFYWMSHVCRHRIVFNITLYRTAVWP